MGKYIKKFDTHSDYEDFIETEDFIKPNVSYCVNDVEVHYNPVDPYNGHTYIDLGLPSGTLWATMNVGANSETDYGNYYMYGMGSKTYNSTDTSYDGTENPLDLSKDTANVVWGGDWHMPTQAQIEELIANTTYEWATINGVNGGKFTATNGNYVFFPAAGYWNNGSSDVVGSGGWYWSSSPEGGNTAYDLSFGDDGNGVFGGNREQGYSVRPVVG